MIQNKIIDSIQETNQILTAKIDSLKIQNQLDKLNYKLDTQNSIVSEVNSFYDSAWIKLIFVITILGIIVPLLVQYFQRKNFKDLIEGIKEKFDTKLDNLQENNELKIDLITQKYEDRIAQLEEKNEKALIELDANTFYLQGRALFTEKNFLNSTASSLKSALLLKRCGRTDRIIPTLNNTLRALKNFTDENFRVFDTYLKNGEEKKSFEDYLIELETDLNSESIIHLKTKELRDFVNEKTSPNNT